VWFTRAPVEELQSWVSQVRGSRGNEGVVIYACAPDNTVLGLVKVKTTEYVIKRRLRESVKGALMSPLDHSEIAGFPGPKQKRATNMLKREACTEREIKYLQSIGCSEEDMPMPQVERRTHDRLTKGMRALSHVPGCSDMHHRWAIFASGFVNWWLENRLRRFVGFPDDVDLPEDRVAGVAQIQKEFETRFASLVAEYEAECGLLETEHISTVAIGLAKQTPLPAWWPEGLTPAASTPEAHSAMFLQAGLEAFVCTALGTAFGVAFPVEAICLSFVEGHGGRCFKTKLSMRTLEEMATARGSKVIAGQLSADMVVANMTRGREDWFVLEKEEIQTSDSCLMFLMITVSETLLGHSYPK